MKNLVTNYGEAMELVHQIVQFDPMNIEIILCMTIDIESAKYKETAGAILDRIFNAVHAVNEELGPYQLDTNDYDHQDKAQDKEKA